MEATQVAKLQGSRGTLKGGRAAELAGLQSAAVAQARSQCSC